MSKIQKVADLAGVSTATVSRALAGKSSVSESTRKKVERAARELGYVVSSSASSLASGRTRNIGIVMPFLNKWFYTTVLKGAQRALSDAGYDLTIYHLDSSAVGQIPTNEDPRRRKLFEEFLKRRRVDGLIAVSLELSPEELDHLNALDRPTVGLGGPVVGVNTLSIDDHAAAHLATSHLLALGHREIAHVAGAQAFDIDFHLPTNRREGYESALQDYGLDTNPLLIKSGDFTIAGGYDATKQLLGDPRINPTAVFVASDEMAIGAILAIRDAGLRVPEDISVVGIDGHDLSEFFGLTTVDQFAEQQGKRAAEHLLASLSDSHSRSKQTQNTLLPFDLVVRSSTAPPAR